MSTQLILQICAYVIIGGLTPVVGVLSSDQVQEITGRTIASMIVLGLIGAATAYKAFTSTAYADSPVARTPARMARLRKKT